MAADWELGKPSTHAYKQMLAILNKSQQLSFASQPALITWAYPDCKNT
jgi:hypothetical protein